MLNEIDKIIKNSHFIELKVQSAKSRNNCLVISNTLTARSVSNVQIFSICMILASFLPHRVRKKKENGPSQAAIVQNL